MYKQQYCIRHRLEAYVGLGIHLLTEKKSSVVFDQFFNSSQTSYQRLPAGSSKLWYCICLPLRRQQSFYSSGFSCCREFKFHHYGLLYCRACVSSEAYTVLFAISDKRKRKFTRHATNIVTHRVYTQGAQKFRSDYCSTQAVARFSAIPSPSPTSASNNQGYARVFGGNPP